FQKTKRGTGNPGPPHLLANGRASEDAGARVVLGDASSLALAIRRIGDAVAATDWTVDERRAHVAGLGPHRPAHTALPLPPYTRREVAEASLRAVASADETASRLGRIACAHSGDYDTGT